jgi:hypothetical protein
MFSSRNQVDQRTYGENFNSNLLKNQSELRIWPFLHQEGGGAVEKRWPFEGLDMQSGGQRFAI